MGGFAVDNNSGGYAFKVDPDGNVKVGDEASDLMQVYYLWRNGDARYEHCKWKPRWTTFKNYNEHNNKQSTNYDRFL